MASWDRTSPGRLSSTATPPTTTSTDPSSGAGRYRGPELCSGDPLGMVREMKALLHEHGNHDGTVAWVEGILGIYDQARAPRSAAEEGGTLEAARARDERARCYEALVLLLCPAEPDPSLPYATLAKRLRKYLSELFTFVRDPQVEATNNLAERILRPLVIGRKVSGGTRSEAGSTTWMTLYSLGATARVQGKDPARTFQQLLLAPPGTPSPLAAPCP